MTVVTTERSSSNNAAFEWLGSKYIDSLDVTVEEYRHKATGAQHYHLAADKDENVFLVALRTVPMDSKGVAHILEHTALCGSERYPVRDPFFMMIRRSLNTFMNAFTSSDWTAYPFASQNRKDFYNLMDVYLDAVFFSRLHELDFAQEGHRLEFADPLDSRSDLTYKGVVFNEMKGAMSAPTSVLQQTLSKYLYPTTTYHFNSGGDPEAIPDLSYTELNRFYKTHYHPSNAVFMTFGDLPVGEHHTRIEEHALSRFQRLNVQIGVGDEKRYLAPVNVEEHYAIGSDEHTKGKTHVVLGWLLGQSTELENRLKAHLLSGVLLNDSASPLREALETTNLGSAPSPLCGLDDSNREMSFTCGIEGSEPGSATALEELVFKVLRKVADEGIEQARIEAVLHQLELSQREIGGDGFPYGLQLLLRGLSTAIHRGDPVTVLNLGPVLDRLRSAIRDPLFIRHLVSEQLLENQHRVRLTLKPDSRLAERREQAEKARLESIRHSLDEGRCKLLVERARELAQRQEEVEDPSVLPKIDLEDIPAETSHIEGKVSDAGGVLITCFDQPTNGLVYQQSISQLDQFAAQDIELLPMLCTLLTEVGIEDQDYLAVQARQSSVTGGMSARMALGSMADDLQTIHGYIVVSGKALSRNQEKLAELLRDTMYSARFDEHSRLREIVSQERVYKVQSVTQRGHLLAMTAAASGLSRSSMLEHQLKGLAGIKRLKKLDQELDEAGALAKFAAELADLHVGLSDAPVHFLVIGELQDSDTSASHLRALWNPPTGKFGVSRSIDYKTRSAVVGQLWTMNTQVNFCARAYPTVEYAHTDAAALTALAVFMRNGFLHRTIREQGGAYGGGARHDMDAGAFQFFSYRDPRLQETLDDFDRSIDWVLNNKHERRLIEEAIIGVVGALDKPASPAGEARKRFFDTLYGRTPELRRLFRDKVLALTVEDLQRVAKQYLRADKASTAVITSFEGLDAHGDLGLTVHNL